MKQIIASILMLCMLPYLAACGVQQDAKDEPDPTTSGSDDPARESHEKDAGSSSESAENEPAQASPETRVPSEADVLAIRDKVEEGMTEEEITRLTVYIATLNIRFERAYFYENIFERLTDPESLYWNYFEKTGKIQVGWAVSEDGTETPVVTTNNYNPDHFSVVIEELKASVKSGLLDEDLDQLVWLCTTAKETHDVWFVKEMYYMLHDMDYFLLRYGATDMGPYVYDKSTVTKYYGSLNVWNES